MYSFIQQLHNKTIAFFLILNALLLILLIPGGMIENRDFSHIDTLILVAFNALLTALVMCSILFIPLAINNYQATAKVSKILALVYIAVYILDLLSIFPQTPSVMSTALMTIEIIGIGAGIMLFIEGYKFEKRINNATYSQNKNMVKKLSPLCTLILVLIGNGVVIFSTYSAIHSSQ
ncbi:hypothetical protein [Thalassotalea agariperforans]